MIMPKPRQYTRLTANGANAQSKEGRLLIFPAWLKHTVPADDGQSERISISFNPMFKNFSETPAAPLWDATAGRRRGCEHSCRGADFQPHHDWTSALRGDHDSPARGRPRAGEDRGPKS